MSDKKRLIAQEGGGFILEDEECKAKRLSILPASYSIELWMTVLRDGVEYEGLQYLTPDEAMKMAQALEQAAVEAFKRKARISTP